VYYKSELNDGNPSIEFLRKEDMLVNPNLIALTAMEFLMQETTVFHGIQERLREAPCML
jgi:hypothetical protein